MDGLFVVILEGESGFCRELAAIVDEAEERLDGVVEVVAIAHLVGGEVDHFQIAEGLDGVASEVFLGFDGEVAELGTGFEVEAGEQAVEVAEAIASEFAFELFRGLVEEGFLTDIADVVDGLVGEILNGGDDGELEVLGDGEGVLVGRFVEAIEQRETIGRAGGIPVE